MIKVFSWAVLFCFASTVYVEKICADGEPFAIVELFGSEGCSSCPPADILLDQLDQEAQQKNQQVYVLSFEVDYWDYLGWKDPFSSNQFTQRQYQYAKIFQTSSVYTPQMIVNGVKAFVGSDGTKARKYIEQFLNVPSSNSIELDIENVGLGQLKIKYRCQQWEPDMDLNIALLERRVQSQVTAGENNGRMLEHTNIVREFKTTHLKDKEGWVELGMLESSDQTKYLVTAYLQNQKTMQITAAKSISLNSIITNE